MESVAHLGDSVTVNGGTADGYWALINYIAGKDFSGEANAAYDSLKTIMDVGEYADYMAAEIYYRNGDRPNNNVRVAALSALSVSLEVHRLADQTTVSTSSGSFPASARPQHALRDQAQRERWLGHFEVFYELLQEADSKIRISSGCS